MFPSLENFGEKKLTTNDLTQPNRASKAHTKPREVEKVAAAAERLGGGVLQHSAIVDQAITTPNDMRPFSPGSGFPDEATEGPCQWFNASVFPASHKEPT